MGVDRQRKWVVKLHKKVLIGWMGGNRERGRSVILTPTLLSFGPSGQNNFHQI